MGFGFMQATADQPMCRSGFLMGSKPIAQKGCAPCLRQIMAIYLDPQVWGKGRLSVPASSPASRLPQEDRQPQACVVPVGAALAGDGPRSGRNILKRQFELTSTGGNL